MTDDHQRASRAPRARVITFVVPPGERRHYGIPAEFGWLLAAAGRHVLIADGTSTTTDLQGALGCFPSVLPHTDSWLPVQDLAAATGDRRLNTATLRRFLPPWRSTDLDVIAWRVPPKAFRFGPAPEVATAIRSVFARLPFDVVLLLSSVAAAPRIADISDVVAVCLPMTEPGARIAASTLREIEAAIWEENPATDAAESPAPPGPGSRRPTLAGIATSKTSEDPERVRRVLAAFRNGVGELARSSLWLGAVQLPIPPYSEDRPLLTTLFEDPGSAVAADNSANRTFGDLIALLSGETAGTRRLPPPQLCRRYRERVVDGPTGAGADRVVVAYAPEDRGWADWVRSELSSAGVATSLLPRRGDLPTLAKDDTVVCLGPSDRFPPPVRTLLAMATNRADPRQRPELVYVRMPGVDDQLAPENIDPAVAHIVDIAGSVPAGAGTAAGRSTMEDLSGTWIRRASVATAAHAEECSARIRAPFLRPERGEVSKRGIRSTQRRGDTHWQARFPLHSRPRYAANVAAPNYRFIGRDAEVEGVRDGLLSAGIRVLSGKAGVGKSEIARSYVSRFQHDYDVTWWVPCQDTRSIRASLEQLRKALAARAELAHAIEVAARGTTPGSEQDPPPAPPVFSLLAALRAGTTDHAPIRCLLVYDDADRLTELSGLLPAPGIAHVVVTTRDTRLSDLDHPSTREPLEVTAVVT